MIKADKVIKSKRKTLSLSVDKDGRVTVRAPYSCSDKRIEEFLIENQGWINRQKERIRKNSEAFSDFGVFDNGKFLLLGKVFTIRMSEVSACEIEERVIYLPKTNPEKELEKTLKRIALNYFTERTEYFSSLSSLVPSSVKVSSAKTRWGSCSRERRINFSFYLIMCPVDVIDYVIVHELCHIKHMNHSSAFWEEVKKYIPDYREKRKWLRDNRYIIDNI